MKSLKVLQDQGVQLCIVVISTSFFGDLLRNI